MERVNYPEEAGVSSKGIYDLLTKLKANGNEHHSLVVLSRGKIAYENYVYPYSADMANQLFSCTKSLVATALGFAIDEGRLKLTDKVTSFYSGYEVYPGTENITIEQLLTMHSHKQFSFMQDMTADYVELFLKAPFRKDKGFLYSNNDAHMVAAILQNVTGESLVDYLTPRLFEPLGIEKPFWETDCKGLNVGGTGVYLKTMDVAKICQAYLDDGRFEGKQVIPPSWCKLATSQKTTANALHGSYPYGYFFWLSKDAARMDGMFGQFGFIFTKSGGVIATTNMKVEEKAIYRTILGAESAIFTDISKPDKLYKQLLDDFYKNERYSVVATSDTLSLIKPIAGKTFKSRGFGKLVTDISGVPSAMLPMSLYKTQAKYDKKGIDDLVFDITDDDKIRINWQENGESISFVAGVDGDPVITDVVKNGYPYKVWAFAYRKENSLHVEYKPLNTVGTQHMVFTVRGSSVKLRISSLPDMGEFCSINGMAGGVLPTTPVIKDIVCGGIKLAFGLCFGRLSFKESK